MKKTYDIGTIGGLLLGFVSIFGSFMLEGGSAGALILLPAMIIVFGGTFAAALIGTSFQKISIFWKLLLLVVRPPKYDAQLTINELVNFATIARREGLLVLEKEIENISSPFLKKIMQLAIDGTEPDDLRSIAEMEVHYLSERHAQGSGLFQRMGGYSPTMGIIGTVMGLIATLAAAGEDPNELIRHIASAFIATLWGVLMANLVWLPISDKLKQIHAEEQLILEMNIVSVIALQRGESPSVIRSKLNSMLPNRETGE